MKKIYFLGPWGTYSELGAKKIKQILNSDAELVPISTISKIVDIIDDSCDSFAVLPVENYIEGIVRPTIDALLAYDVEICLQIEVKIEHCLFSKGKKNDIKHIISHPQALAQCSKYILDNFDEKIDLINASSTADAVEIVSKKDETYGAIAACDAGICRHLNLIDKNISDIKDNKTRFVLVSKSKISIGKNSRTSIAFSTKNRPGALLEVLEIFKKYNLNLVYLESRPSKKVFGEYNFFADIDKGIDEILPAIDEIKKTCDFYKFLGSYPSV